MVRANEFGVTEVELFENYWVSDVEFKVIKSMSKYKQNKLIKDLKQAMDLKRGKMINWLIIERVKRKWLKNLLVLAYEFIFIELSFYFMVGHFIFIRG